jgi:cysteine desulfurase
MARDRIYLDHAATTPVLPEAQAAMADALKAWANPSSPHADGRASRAALEQARARIADSLVWRHDVILTSGASEAIAIAASRANVPGRSLGPTEHDSVVAAMGPTAVQILVDEGGVIDPAVLKVELAEGPALVAIQHVNNETGVVQPLGAIAKTVREVGSLLLADCAQSAGKIPLPDADFIAVSAHKLGGPPGMGALLVKDIATLAPSGGQEKGYRRGTENVPAAAGFAAALQARAFADAMPWLADLRKKLEDAVVADGGLVVAAESDRIATIGAYALPGVTSASQLVQFDLAGFAISAGSACSSGSMKTSRVLEAMGVPPEVAGSVIRVSFGPSTSANDVDRFLTEWRRVAEKAGAKAA